MKSDQFNKNVLYSLVTVRSTTIEGKDDAVLQKGGTMYNTLDQVQL